MNFRKCLPPLCLFAFLALVFFFPLLFSGLILARGDTYNYFYPYWDIRNAAFRAGELPLWTPDLFMGAPLLANPQLGVYYPPNWLTAPFRAPAAIALSIVFHVVLAAAGAAWLYRESIGKGWLPAIAAGLVFAFSGHIGAHVEQINQLQGLAWMPLLFALYHRVSSRGAPLRDGLPLAIAWAMQILSGHTQTVFISGVGLLLFGLARACLAPDETSLSRRLPRSMLLLALPFGAALLLSLPQLLPSLELLQLSNRSDGFDLRSATSFSLPPSMLGRGLLPSFDGQPYSEYLAWLGVLGLGLALWGIACRARADRQCQIWLLLALAGLALAFGRFNPLYLPLAELPGFNLFRVPARFLALYSLAMALLAGMGVDALASARERSAGRAAAVAGALAAMLLAAAFVLRADPGLIFGHAPLGAASLGHWLIAWLLLLFLLHSRHRHRGLAAVLLLTLELFLAARNLPYNDLAPADVYFAPRDAIHRLRADQGDELPPGRLLAISQLFFDPADIDALRQQYAKRDMDAAAQFQALVAVKKLTTLMPNQSLVWGLPTLDGFGGGITPTRHYARFSALLLPDGAEPAVDGRLGERLALSECWGACIPNLRWLRATDARALITDRVHDFWHDEIEYDTTLWRFWREAPALDFADSPLDEVRVLHTAPFSDDRAVALDYGLLLTVTDPAGLKALLDEGERILAVSLVDSRDPSTFQPLQPPPFQRVLASDIEVYRLPAGERAFLAPQPVILPADAAGDQAALELLQAGEAVVIQGAAETRDLELAGGAVEITRYSATAVDLRVNAPAPAYLVLADAHYPGWKASVDGAPTPIYRANLLFRALPVPAGESSVRFRFEPALWRDALLAGGLCWLIALALLVHLWRAKGTSQIRETE